VVDVVQQVNIVAQGFARRFKKLRHHAHIGLGVPQVLGRQVGVGRLVEHLVLGDTIGAGQARYTALQADRLVALGLVVEGHIDRILDRDAVGVAVDHDGLARGAAQKLVKRQAGHLGLDVPQRHIDGGDGRHGHRAAPPVGALVEILPDVLDLVGVAADKAGNDVVGEIAGDGQFAAVERGVADAVDALVGLDLQGDEVAARAGDDHLRRADDQPAGAGRRIRGISVVTGSVYGVHGYAQPFTRLHSAFLIGHTNKLF